MTEAARSRWLAAGLALAVLLAAPAPRAAQDLPPREVERLLRQGSRALESARNQLRREERDVARRRIEEAGEAYGRILDADPTHPEAAVGMGAVYYLTQRHAEAIDLLRPVAARHPDDVDLAHQLGLNLYREGRTDEAMPLLTRAAEDGDRPDAMWLLAVHHYRAADWEQGLGYLEHYTEARPADARALGLLGTYYLKLGRYDDAVEALDRFLVTAPDNVSARINRANALLRAGRTDDAGEAYEALVREHPERLRLLYNLAAVRIRQDRCADALPLLERFLAEEPGHATALYFEADCLLRTGRLEEARETFRRVVERSPNNPWAHHGLSRIAERTDRPGDAFHRARQAVDLAPDEWELASRYGTLLRRGGRPAEALEWHDRAAGQAPERPGIAVERGRDLWALGRMEDAGGAFARAVGLAPDHAVARESLAAVRTTLGVSARRAGRLGAARDHLEAALEARPGYGPAVANLALLELEAGQRDAALEALAHAPEDAGPDVDAVRAAVLADAGRVDEARDAVDRALAGETALRPLALRVHARLAARRGDWSAAAEAFEEAAGDAPSESLRSARALARLHVGFDHLAAGRDARALDALEEVAADRDLLATDDRRRLDLARAAAAVGAHPTEARLRALEDLLEDRRVRTAAGRGAVDAARLRLARGLLRLDRHEEALAALDTVRAGSRADAAARALERAARDRRARDLFAAGKPDEAARIWRSLQQGHEDPRIAHDLAAADFAGGRTSEAARTWQRQVEEEGTAEAWFNLALVMDRRAEYRRAWELMRGYLDRGGVAAERARRRVEDKEAVFGFREGAQ
ncbi:MAG: tetratricopeptide repeat protein [Myxococcota bacterium]